MFEQYDFDFDGGHNSSTSATLVRKLERWYMAVTMVYTQSGNEVSVYLTFWPEGIPEVHMGTSRMSLLGISTMN